MANKPKLELVPDAPHASAPPPAEHPTPGVGGYYERDPFTGIVTRRVPEPAAPQPSPIEPE